MKCWEDPQKREKYDRYGKDWEQGEEYEKYRQSQEQQARSAHRSSSGSFGGSDFSSFFESMFGGQRGSRTQGTSRGPDSSAELKLDLGETYHTHKQTFSVNGRKIRITIPVGVENGQVIRLRGQGGPGANGSPNGDLYITFSVADSSGFKRAGNDLHSVKEIDLYTALLGGEITVDTMDGKIKMKVATETANGTKVRVKGKGFPIYKKEGAFGDLYVTFNIILPAKLTEREKELFTELAILSK